MKFEKDRNFQNSTCIWLGSKFRFRRNNVLIEKSESLNPKIIGSIANGMPASEIQPKINFNIISNKQMHFACTHQFNQFHSVFSYVACYHFLLFFAVRTFKIRLVYRNLSLNASLSPFKVDFIVANRFQLVIKKTSVFLLLSAHASNLDTM